MGQVEDPLVVRVGVDRRHHPLLDAERLVDDHDRRGEAVRRAGGVGDDVVLLRLVALVVDPHHDRQVLLLGGGGDDHLLRAGLEVGGGLRTGQEQTGALDHDIDPLVVPGDGRGIAKGQALDRFPVDDETVLLDADLPRDSGRSSCRT